MKIIRFNENSEKNTQQLEDGDYVICKLIDKNYIETMNISDTDLETINDYLLNNAGKILNHFKEYDTNLHTCYNITYNKNELPKIIINYGLCGTSTSSELFLTFYENEIIRKATEDEIYKYHLKNTTQKFNV